jgi:hypothetical protein
VTSFSLKTLLLRIARAIGLFSLARRRVDGRLLILAYHGVAQADEHEWRPKLFMSRETFERRLACLRRWHVPVRPLGDGLADLQRGTQAPYAVALTFDDGYYNFTALALPYLEAAGAAATVYVCTYYSLHTGWPVFDLAVDYMFWKRPAGLVPGDVLGEAEPLTGATPVERERSAARVYAFAEREKMGGAEKNSLARTLAAHLDYPYEDLVERRTLSLMSGDELRRVVSRGAAVGLHTHRHAILESPVGLRDEIAENRAALTGLGVAPGPDFCYPSGEWAADMWSILEREGIRSATTCEPGVARPDTPRYALPRFLDTERTADIEFEAWVSGFMPWLIDLTGRSPGQTPVPPAATPGPAVTHRARDRA